MKYERYDVIEFDNNKKYVVVEVINYNNELYLYLANEDESRDYIVVKESKNDKKEFIPVTNEKELQIILKNVIEKNKDLLNEIFNNKNKEENGEKN